MYLIIGKVNRTTEVGNFRREILLLKNLHVVHMIYTQDSTGKDHMRTKHQPLLIIRCTRTQHILR